MFKKIVVSLMVAMVAVAPIQMVCFAGNQETAIVQGIDISPRYVNVKRFEAKLSISSNTASCTVNYCLVDPSYTAKCQIYLEYSADKSDWHYLTSWTKNGSDEERYEEKRNLGFSESYYYRVRSVLTVYNASGKQVEKVEETSDIVS